MRKPLVACVLIGSFCVTSLAQMVAAPAAPTTQPKAHDFAKWEKEISAYEAADKTSPPPKGGLVFTGSSTIRRWATMADDLKGYQVLNRGFGGSEILDATHFADRIIFPYEPKMVLIRAGGNDIHNGKSPEAVFADFQEFVATIHSRLPNAQIVYISQGPSIARITETEKQKTLNDMVLGMLAKTPYVKYIETFDLPLGPDGKPRADLFVEDKLHFNAEGNRL
ncbi:MAG TPA: GDSL-type esterase/lipase family protein, partial [Tepidisphaeraceae bacterium]